MTTPLDISVNREKGLNVSTRGENDSSVSKRLKECDAPSKGQNLPVSGSSGMKKLDIP